MLDGIKDQVVTGVAVAVIQKAEGADAGRGGQFTKDFTDLELLIDKLGDTKTIVVKDQIIDAIDYAKSIAKKSDLICITGSLFTVGEARDYLVSNLQKC